MNTEIYNLDYLDILDKYNSKNTFFMIDPPYNVSNINNYYRGRGSEFNHEELRNILKNINGIWIVRYNNEELTRDLYKDTNILFKTSKKIIGIDYEEIYYTNIRSS